MTFLPVVAREMLALSRRKATYRSRVAVAVIAIGVMAYLLLLSFGPLSYAQQGRSVFAVISCLSFGYCLIAGLIATSDCVSEEKREGTLGLLFLTNLKSYDIILGKLAATSLSTVYSLFAILPMLALTLLLGGVAMKEVGLQALVLMNTMFLSLTTGIMISTWFKNERKALLAAVLTLGFIVCGPYVIGLALNGMDRAPEELVWPSPIYAFTTILLAPTGWLKGSFFSVSLMFQHILAWLMLWIAARVLPGKVNELPRRRFLKLQHWFHDVVFGNAAVRKKYRARLLDRNPFLWLASRERVKKNYAWVVILFFGTLYGWMYSDKTLVLDLTITGAILFLTHFIFKIWVASEVCSRLIEDKRSGALELLLSSPLSVREIAHGQHLALRRIFGGPILVLVLSELLVMNLTLSLNRATVTETLVFFFAAISSLLLDLWALKWAGLWSSLFGKSMERVVMSVMAWILGLPWIVFIVSSLVVNGIAAAFGVKVPDWWMVASWAAIGIIVSGIIGFSSRIKFLTYFREAASHVFNPGTRSETGVGTILRNYLFRTRSAKFVRLVPSFMWKHPIPSLSVLILLIFITIVAGREYLWKRELEQRLVQIRAKGEPASLQEVGKYLPVVPPEQNAYFILKNAGGINMVNMPHKDLQRLWAGDSRVRTGDLGSSIKLLLKNNQKVLDAIQSLTNYPNSSRVVEGGESRQDYSIYALPELMKAELADALGLLDNEGQLTDAEQERVVADLLSTLALAGTMRQFRENDGQWVCSVTINVFRDGFQSALPRMNFDEKTLKEFQRQLKRFDNSDYFAETIAVHRAKTIEFEQAYSGNKAANMEMALLNFVAWLSGNQSKRFSIYLDQLTELLEMSKRDFSSVVNGKSGNLLLNLAGSIAGGRWSGANIVDSMIQNEATLRTQVEILQCAIASELYKTKKGKRPQQLEQLVPGYLQAIPVDLFASGKPLAYEFVSDNEFKIYSVGRPGLAGTGFLMFQPGGKQTN